MTTRDLTDCDLCGSRGPFLRIVVADGACDPVLATLGVRGPYTTVLCRACGWVFKPGLLDSSQITRLYGTYGGEATYEPRAARHYWLRSRQLFELLKPELGLSDRFCTVLDVGGGVGQLSQVFAERGHHVCILDIAPTRALHPAMTVRRGQLGELDEGDRFDLILLSHVLEHVWSPSELLKHAYNHLGDKGALFVEVPFELYTPFIKRKLGDPRHVGYFARHTLGRYLEQTGFQVAWVRRDLGLYDTRRIMVLRALAFPAVSSASSFNPWGRLSWLRTPLEMLHPRQVSHVARRTRPSKLRK